MKSFRLARDQGHRWPGSTPKHEKAFLNCLIKATTRFTARINPNVGKPFVCYGLAVRGARTPFTSYEFQYQAIACLNLGILLTLPQHKNGHKAATLFKRAAIEFNLPAGMYLYGYCLLRGFGGVKQNIAAGVAC